MLRAYPQSGALALDPRGLYPKPFNGCNKFHDAVS